MTTAAPFSPAALEAAQAVTTENRALVYLSEHHTAVHVRHCMDCEVVYAVELYATLRGPVVALSTGLCGECHERREKQ